MNFFLLTNPHARLNMQPPSPGNPRSFPLKTRAIGPKRPRNLRRKSKNCANAKIQRRQRQKESKQAAVKLQEQIRQLDRQLTLMNEQTVQMRPRTQDAAFHTMNEYFQHIKRGINPAKHPSEAHATKNFLLATFANDLKSPDYTGLDQFVEQWQLLSEYHADIECQLSRIEVNPFVDGNLDLGDGEVEQYVNVAKTYGTTTLQISRTTIERVFPHILNDEELVQWLIGKTYSFSFTLIAYVDATTGRVFQIESKVDLTSALLDLLQDPFVTIKMVEATKMSKHGNLLLTTDVQEGQNVIENGFL
ncbi:hypothetical protein PF005_g14688 [Phytophthora fragariae]|uniref:BZIP domain-containing protein n=2 Tax=Phytophthora fragariae TaxID=53985 RepID=A0A6A3XMP8_9STRA|nr:hypothetical protein PF003_g33262 [Phytophthora fragariae]KAE8929698.1 hypothetical protein PF009_g20195 [Phytophthora fragariae]KAE8988243.1 hypothetical protein PF011_g19244 [Phytophthora fragariae]KAE9086983.1 hypothetical protein PF010_g19891 [Phytophthora fragariae]KAE9091588.1 hypothetical protein PF007_g18827 [Phytophthora fragariae]